MKNGATLLISPQEGAVHFQTVGWHCFQYGEWEPHVECCLRALLLPGTSALDIGANLGYHTVAMAQCVGDAGTVYSFEPFPSVYERLRLAVQYNLLSRVETFPVAVGTDDDEAQFYGTELATGHASFHRDIIASMSKVHHVNRRSLDSLFACGTVASADVLKIDIEGHEYAALRGAKRLLQTCRPHVILEINGRMSAVAGWTAADIGNTLSSCGDYRIFIIQPTGLRPVECESLQVHSDTHVDILALNLDHRHGLSVGEVMSRFGRMTDRRGECLARETVWT